MQFQNKILELRPFEAEDVEALQVVLNHPELSGSRYIPHGFPEEIPLSTKQVEAIINKWGEAKMEAHFAIVLSENQELIGHAEMEWEWDPRTPWVAVVIAPPFQRRGFGSKVLQILLRYLFMSTVAHNVSGWMADWNRAARAFAEMHGLQDVGRSRREGIREGAFYDGILVDMLRPEWQAAQEE
jgi:RimJ/RimL family protein N-acetyltransferase